MTSRGRQPTESIKKHIRPRKGRTFFDRANRGLHPRLFMFCHFAAMDFWDSVKMHPALSLSGCAIICQQEGTTL